MSFYIDNMELLNSLSDSFLPMIQVPRVSNEGIYEYWTIPEIGMDKCDKLISYMIKRDHLHLTPADRNREIAILLNDTLQNIPETDTMGDIDSLFDENIQYTLLFMLISSIVCTNSLYMSCCAMLQTL